MPLMRILQLRAEGHSDTSKARFRELTLPSDNSSYLTAEQTEQGFIWLAILAQHLPMVRVLLSTFIECYHVKLPVSLSCRFLDGKAF